MSLLKNRPVDVIDRLTSSFKNFEMKLEKLQDDLNFHGQTLSDLRLMMLNLSSGIIASPDGKFGDSLKRLHKRTMAIQHDNRLLDSKIMRKKSLQKSLQKHSALVNIKGSGQPLALNLKPKTLAMQKRLSTLSPPYQSQLSKLEKNQIHMQRHRKVEMARKAMGLRIKDKKIKKLSDKKLKI